MTEDVKDKVAAEEETMIAQFNRFEIKMTLEQAQSCSHQGQCGEDVEAMMGRRAIIQQLEKIGMDKIRAELEEYGAWDDEELQDEYANHKRIVWCAANSIVEEEFEKRRKS